MTEVVIRNKEFLKTLDGFVDDFFSRPYDDPKYTMVSSERAKTEPEYFTSREYLDECLKGDPIGPPAESVGNPISYMVRQDKEIWHDYMLRVKYDFASEIGAHTSALLNYYPKGGFVGWHTNWDAHCYQVLFTWSRTGNGYFRYYDKDKDEIIHIPDVAGWQCRYYYFGRIDEPEHLCWHSAYAGEDRITLAYKFANQSLTHPDNDKALAMRAALLEDITNDSSDL